MSYLLGVDGGATKTVAQISDIGGSVIVEKLSGSSNYKSSGISKATVNLGNSILEAINELNINEPVKIPIFLSACFGLAGCDSTYDIEIYKKIIFNKKIKKYLPPKKILICNDTRIGLAVGSNNNNNKVILISGTGANCYGINEKGQEAHSNGWDYILGDEGSGYSMGLKALKAIMKAYDNRGPKTMLTGIVLQTLGLQTEMDLMDWIYDEKFSKDKVASIGKILCDTAELDDRVSVKILKEEAGEAVISAMAVIKKLGLKNKEFDFIFVGNLFKTDKYFKEILTDKLKKACSKIKFVPLNNKPVTGAIKIAKDML